MQDMERRLMDIFHEAIGPHVVLHDELTADKTEGWDSLAHVNLIFAIEEEFHVRFSPEEMASMINVGELKTIIREKVGR